MREKNCSLKAFKVFANYLRLGRDKDISPQSIISPDHIFLAKISNPKKSVISDAYHNSLKFES
jgi:hypothetical protein